MADETFEDREMRKWRKPLISFFLLNLRFPFSVIFYNVFTKMAVLMAAILYGQGTWQFNIVCHREWKYFAITQRQVRLAVGTKDEVDKGMSKDRKKKLATIATAEQ